MLGQLERTTGDFARGRSENYWLSLMPDAELLYTPSEVKKAGRILRSFNPDVMSPLRDLQWALEVFTNWRACHRVPMNQFYESLLEYVAATGSPQRMVIVQRPKRIDAVMKKLQRDPRAQLSTMQDIVGCRAIVRSINEVDRLVKDCERLWSQHTLRNVYPYIEKPNANTGYRGVHLVFAFHSDHEAFNGRLVEVQIRTLGQHAWATAVETVDLIQKQSLKSGHGDPRWQRFFCLMSSAIAQMELRPPVPDTPTKFGEIVSELRRYEEELRVRHHLQLYGALARVIDQHEGVLGEISGEIQLFLMDLDVETKQTKVRGYGESEIQQAYRDVAAAEAAGRNVVLAGASGFLQLRQAYPNWFIDARQFLRILNKTLGEDIHSEV